MENRKVSAVYIEMLIVTLQVAQPKEHEEEGSQTRAGPARTRANSTNEGGHECRRAGMNE